MTIDEALKIQNTGKKAKRPIRRGEYIHVCHCEIIQDPQTGKRYVDFQQYNFNFPRGVPISLENNKKRGGRKYDNR